MSVLNATKSGIEFRSFDDAGERTVESTIAKFDRFPSGMRRGPRVATSGDAIVVTAIVGKPAKLVAWRSTDGGETWKMTADAIGGEPDAVREGLHDMAVGPDGTMAVVWLDMRNEGTEIWIAESADAGLTWSEARCFYKNPAGTVCECCHPTVRYGPGGKPIVLFRNSLDGNRDMYLTRGDGSAEKLGEGSWPLEGCPMDGGDFCVTDDGEIITAWRREGTVYLSRPGEPEQAIGEGSQPTIALFADGTPVVFYTGPAGLNAFVPGHGTFRLTSDGGSYPNAVQHGGSVAVACESKSGSTVLEFANLAALKKVAIE